MSSTKPNVRAAQPSGAARTPENRAASRGSRRASFSRDTQTIKSSKATESLGSGGYQVLLNKKNVTPRRLYTAVPSEADAPTGEDVDVGNSPHSPSDLLLGQQQQQQGDTASSLTTHQRAAAPAGGSTHRSTTSALGSGRREAPPESEVYIHLEETNTHVLFTRPSTSVLIDSEAFARVTKRNKMYLDLKSSKQTAAATRYKVGHTQTLNKHKKISAVGTDAQAFLSQGVAASPAEIHDALVAKPKTALEDFQTAWEQTSKNFTEEGLKTPGTLLSLDWESCLTSERSSRPAGGSGGLSSNASSSLASLSRGTESSTLLQQREEGTKTTKKQLSANNSTTTNFTHSARQISDFKKRAEAPRRRSHRLSDSGDGGMKKALEAALSKRDTTPPDPKSDWTIAAGGELPEGVWTASQQIERALLQQQFHREQMKFRNFAAQELFVNPMHAEASPAVSSGRTTRRLSEKRGSEESESEKESVKGETGGGSKQQLKEFLDFDGRSFAQGHGVRGITVHEARRDFIAAAYSSSPCDAQAARTGSILLWSIANPLRPTRSIACRCGVTTLAFSPKQPDVLAGGQLDGGVSLWDLRVSTQLPILQSATLDGPLACQHSDTVWDLKWIFKEGNEGLLTVGGDGQVLQWSFQKGLVHSLAMTLRRTHNPKALQAVLPKGDSRKTRLFRHAVGLSLAIPEVENSIYYVATDEGLIHKCSLAYDEQFLDTYVGHRGPVNTVRFITPKP